MSAVESEEQGCFQWCCSPSASDKVLQKMLSKCLNFANVIQKVHRQVPRAFLFLSNNGGSTVRKKLELVLTIPPMCQEPMVYKKGWVKESSLSFFWGECDESWMHFDKLLYFCNATAAYGICFSKRRVFESMCVSAWQEPCNCSLMFSPVL